MGQVSKARMVTPAAVAKYLRRLLVFSLGIVWIIFLPSMFLLLTPLHLYRRVVAIYARFFRKDLGKMVPPQSAIMAIDDMGGRPECNVVIWFGLKGQMPLKEFQASFEDKVLNLRDKQGDLVYPELRQYFHTDMGYLFWKWDTNFSIQNHIKVCSELGPTGQKPTTREQVLMYNEKLLCRPWHLKRSPWQFLLVPNYGGSGSSEEPETLVLFHLHHGMGDGYSFLKMILKHMWGQSEKAQVAKPKSIAEKREGSFTNILRAASLPLNVLYDFGKQSLRYDQSVWHLQESQLKRKWKVAKTLGIPISFIKEIKRGHNVSFTAVLAGAVAGGLRNYFKSEGFPIPGLMHVFVPMPFPNHPDDRLTNHMTGCMVSLPIGKPTPQERLQYSHEHLERIKRSTIPLINYGMAMFAGALPTCFRALNKNYHAAGIFSNFPGNEEPIYIFNREVTEFSYNVASLHGCAGFTLTALSYGHHVSIDLTIDCALLKSQNSVQRIIDEIREEFNVLWELQKLN